MGGKRALRVHRTAAALVLTAVAVAVPSGAWFFAGMRKIEREAHLEEQGIYDQSYKKGAVMAQRLAARLELLREGESGRPFYVFQNLIHDPRGASEGIAVSVSPLAQGATDPLIEAYFQVDEAGRLTLPTLNDEFPELGLHADEADQCLMLSKLEEVAFYCARENCQQAYPGSRKELAGGDGGQVEVLSERAWRQHRRANALYAGLMSGKSGRDLDLASGASASVEVVMKPFSWHSLPVGGEPGLVALRTVQTPAGRWTQGFVVSLPAAGQYLEGSSYSAAFVHLDPSEATPPGEARVPIEGTPWEVALDVSERLETILSKASAERSRFLKLFLLGVLAAGLSGLLVVAMVHQSERLAQQRAQFAASAAHELRTPLAGLRLYGEMLAEGLGDPSRARDYARRLAGEAERLGRVVTNVLSFTRLERGLLRLDPQPGDLAAAVRDACQRQAQALEESGARLELALGDDLPAVVFDRDALGHILQNLLDNAEKYTREVEDRLIRVGLEPNGRGIDLKVSDNGPGVSPQLRRRLFRPYTRGDDEDAPAGLGLGLVLVKLLTEAQGGEISYADAPAGGAVFTVTMPRARLV